MAVNTKPINISNNGFVAEESKFITAGLLLIIFIEVLINLIPTNMIPMPLISIPALATLSFPDIAINAPTHANAVKNGVIGKLCKAVICAVMVVPIFAPIMMLVACLSVIIPALTKPTTITVVADDD